jgi:hypothetical protein
MEVDAGMTQNDLQRAIADLILARVYAMPITAWADMPACIAKASRDVRGELEALR